MRLGCLAIRRTDWSTSSRPIPALRWKKCATSSACAQAAPPLWLPALNDAKPGRNPTAPIACGAAHALPGLRKMKYAAPTMHNAAHK